jgi:hypothetical protein
MSSISRRAAYNPSLLAPRQRLRTTFIDLILPNGKRSFSFRASTLKLYSTRENILNWRKRVRVESAHKRKFNNMQGHGWHLRPRKAAVERAVAADFFWYQHLGEIQGRSEWFGGSQQTVYSQEDLRELIRQSGKQLVEVDNPCEMEYRLSLDEATAIQ